jgi:pyridoxal phosphate enzyme (YggS family)
MTIAERISILKAQLPECVTLIAVSKTKPANMILEAYEGGQRHFGENKVQEMVDKQAALPIDIQWHLIGHLQSNKVKYIAPFVSLIHSVDSLKLLIEIDKQAHKHNRVINCLLQFHIAKEETKFGLSIDEAVELLDDTAFKSLHNVNIVGVMGMASFTENREQIRAEFAHLKNIFDSLKSRFFLDKDNFKEISMGMSGDYQLAIEQGSTMIRVGSSIFGGR